MSDEETTTGAGDAALQGSPVPKLRPIEAVHYKHEGQDMFCLRDPTRISDRELHVSPDVFMIASLFDGERRLADIRAEFTKRFAMDTPAQSVARVADALENAHFLESPAFERYRASVEDEFRGLEVRQPVLSGSCYPAKPDEIRSFLDAFFTGGEAGEDAPGVPGPRQSGVKPFRALIAPHIDLRRDGVTYAYAYKAMWERPLAEVVVLMGTAHGGRGDLFTFTRKDFETPLGRVKNDIDLTERLASAVGEGAFRDEYVHKGEHSIEIQLVWLQHMSEKYGGECPGIVPVLAGPLRELVVSPHEGEASPMKLGEMERFVGALARALIEGEGRVMLLASADLAHIGQKFGDDVPLTPRLLRRNREEDRKMLALVQAGDAEGFFEFVRKEEDRRRICGLTSIYACLAACQRAAGDAKASAELLHYDVSPENETQSLVSYAALAIR